MRDRVYLVQMDFGTLGPMLVWIEQMSVGGDDDNFGIMQIELGQVAANCCNYST